MYLNFSVYKNHKWMPFCGLGALEHAESFAGAEGVIWAMTRDRAEELGLLKPTTAQHFRDVAIEADVLYACASMERKARPS